MPLSRSSWFLALAVAGGMVGGTTLSTRSAAAGPEIGATIGPHVFSEANELGVPDSSTADSLRSSVLFGLRVGYFFTDVLGLEGEIGLIPTEAVSATSDVWLLTYRAHLAAQFGAANPATKVVPFVVLGVGAMTVLDSKADTISKDTDELFYVGAGLKYRVGNGWGLRADLRVLFPPSSQSEFATVDFEGLVSVYKDFGHRAAPVEEGPPPPPPVVDSDGDGIPDDVDQCPHEPEDLDGFQDEDGCPDLDNDGDGIADAADQCPNEPEDFDGFQDADGCPDPDNDGDGIPDATDQCPNEPEDFDGFQDADGCPDPDNDGDGVPDAQDQCPDTLETWNGFQDDDGCPDELPKAVQRYTGVIKGITFKTKSAEILRASFKTLDAAVKVLQEYPDLRMEIQGHTDDVGDDDFNLDLSQRRAESVRAYFAAKGVDENRLVARGYGETQPIDPRTTRSARAKNRRVEFRLITRQDALEGAEPPAPAPVP
jgi:outer membrane protein OmpA-like peptidoglycan-associated protein/outer membrane protein W